jgi:preprotein translocase subunit YajC
LGPIIWLLPLLLLFFIFMTGSTQRREKKRMAQLMSNLKKQDKVLTIGGIIGTVAEIRDDEIVLKVDENSNTRMRFTRNAIQQVLKASDVAQLTPGNPVDPKIEVKAGKGERATV